MRKVSYEAVSFASDSCKAFLEEKEQFYPLWHYHPEYELVYILRGKGIRYVGNVIENFEEHDLVLIGPNLPHCWRNTVNTKLKARAIVIQWKESLINHQWADISEFKSISKLLEASKKGLRFDAAVASGLKDKLIAITRLPPFEKFIQLMQLLNELSKTPRVHALCEQEFIYNFDLTENERINKVYSYVKLHYQDKVTLKDVASYVNMSEEYFSRFFSKIMKKAFFVFLNEYRINMACQLLIDTDLNVKQICYSCGYDSIPFFYRQFKRVKGYSPLTYKLQYQLVNK